MKNLKDIHVTVVQAEQVKVGTAYKTVYHRLYKTWAHFRHEKLQLDYTAAVIYSKYTSVITIPNPRNYTIGANWCIEMPDGTMHQVVYTDEYEDKAGKDIKLYCKKPTTTITPDNVL